MDESLQQKVAPLTRKIAKVDPISSASNQQDKLFWYLLLILMIYLKTIILCILFTLFFVVLLSRGKPEKSSLSLLRWGTDARVEIMSHQGGQFSGSLACPEVYDIAEKLWLSLPSLSKNLTNNTRFW